MKNSRELKEKVRHWRIENNDLLDSVAVKNLYPSIPITEALELIEGLLKGTPALRDVTELSVYSIMKLLKWTFELFFCEFDGKYYVLDSGPIGLGAIGN